MSITEHHRAIANDLTPFELDLCFTDLVKQYPWQDSMAAVRFSEAVKRMPVEYQEKARLAYAIFQSYDLVLPTVIANSLGVVLTWHDVNTVAVAFTTYGMGFSLHGFGHKGVLVKVDSDVKYENTLKALAQFCTGRAQIQGGN